MFGCKVNIEKMIGSGAQGDVYLVQYEGRPMALKWYNLQKIYDLAAFVANLKRNIRKGAPSRDFLWPLDMTDYHDGTFGYIMDLYPADYWEAKEFLIGNVGFPSYRRRIDACLNIVSAFRILHAHGYAYCDLNASNFVINPATGRVLIYDNDNVTLNNKESGVLGTLSYMAPEIIMRRSLPNKYSDRHSLAVLLYRMLLGPHPLEGRRSENTVLDTNMRRELFGADALFAMDPYDSSNAPNPRTQGDLIGLWRQLPDHLRTMFEQAFSQEALHDPYMRPIEADWLSSLTRLRSETVMCECGNEVCCADGHPVCCECGRVVRTHFVAHVHGTTLPVSRDMRVYRCQLGGTSQSDALDLVARAIASLDEPSILGIRNMGESVWRVHSPRYGSYHLTHDEVQEVEDGVVLEIPKAVGYERINFERNGY
jgi:serine/threonine protein kinase